MPALLDEDGDPLLDELGSELLAEGDESPTSTLTLTHPRRRAGPAWRFLLFDAVTREPQAELACAGGVSWAEELNGPGSFQATISLDQPAFSPVTMAALAPPRAVFAVEKDDVLLGAWFVWTHDYDLAAGTVTLAGEGWLSYLRRRVLRQTMDFYAEGGDSQEEIAWTLIDYAQDQTGGNVGIVDESVWSNVLRERHYFQYERKFVGQLIEQLAAVDNGFDFRLVPRWTEGPNSSLEVAWTTLTPPLGRDTDLVLVDGEGGVVVPSVTLDGTALTYQAHAVGRGEGEATPIRRWWDDELIGANLLLEDVTVHSDVSELDTLDDYANHRLNRGQVPVVIPRMQVPLSVLGELVVGDQVQVRVNRGVLQVDDRYRVTGLAVDLPADGAEKVDLTLAPLALFQEV